MRDVLYPVRKAYYEALAGNITHNGQTVHISENVPSGQAFPYVVITEQTMGEGRSMKNCTAYDVTILIQIITGFRGNAGGHKDADLIADRIYELLGAGLPAQYGVQIANARIVMDRNESREATPTHSIYRRLIRIRNQVFEQL